jgi:uncharacterized membrane protein
MLYRRLAVRIVALSLTVGWLLSLVQVVATAAEGWTITDFRAAIQIQSSGDLDITEAIQVDFGTLQKHGIFRDIPAVYEYNDKSNRVYHVDVQSVTDAQGRPWTYTTSQQGPYLQVKIGDANRTVSGAQTYTIHYRVGDALNAFSDHDELNWNVNGGNWPVPMNHVLARVSLPASGLTQATCFQGAMGSTEPCRHTETADGASFEATRPLGVGEQLTVVLGLQKGLVSAPTVALENKPRAAADYLALSPATISITLLGVALAVGWVISMWWRRGRDYAYTKAYYLNEDPGPEQIRPLFRPEAIVPEYEPPAKLRPAQLGLILDERADTKDVTATIVDLAVRGYLRIEEHGKKDWKIIRIRKDSEGLLPYESKIFEGLFRDHPTEVLISDLKMHFRSTLNSAEDALYKDATQRRWFTGNPQGVRYLWIAAGIGLALLGVGITFGLGALFGWGLVGLPVVLAGILLSLGSGFMPRRTGLGRAILQRTLGFRLYMNAAEKQQQRFAERENIFTSYLPYAIVFGCVQRWAKAFKDIDTSKATSGWYVGNAPFTALVFSSNLETFSGQVGSAITSTPGSSGSSGFSGGFSGGGGGGGGGGSW